MGFRNTLSLLGKGIASLLKDGLIEKFRQETTEIRWGPDRNNGS